MTGLLLVAALLLATTSAPAQSTSDRPSRGGSRLGPALGVHVGGPARVSAVLGASLTLDRRREDFLFAALEPGWKGDRVSAGYGRMLSNLGSLASGRATLLRMRHEPAPMTYAGMEAQFAPLFILGLRVGAFTPVRGDRARSPMLLADFSVGL